MDDMGQLVVYRYIEHRILPKSLFNTHADLCLLVFGPNPEELCDPSIEPVGIFHEAGMRSYIWRDSFWVETDWDRRQTVSTAQQLLINSKTYDEADNYRRIAELAIASPRYGAPSPTDGKPPLKDEITVLIQSILKIPITDMLMDKNRKKKYIRAIYRINK